MILLTTDILSERYPTIRYHSKGILKIIADTIECLNINEKIEIYGSSPILHKEFDSQLFFSMSKLSYVDELPPLFTINKFSEQSINYIKRFLNKYSLIIGYELTDQTIELLNLLNIKYVNIWLHPIRFMDDEIFLISSNAPNISNELKKYNISESSYFVHASYAKNLINLKYPIDIKNNSCVFFGQTANDKTLRKKDGYIKVNDFEKELFEIFLCYENIYYCKHPLNQSDIEYDFLVGLAPNIQKLNVNSYQVLANENLNIVVTISSSIALEAYYFKKNAIYLNKPIVDIHKKNTYSIDSTLLSPKFWSDLLKVPEKYPGKFFIVKNNKVRNSLNSYYSYPILKDHYDAK
ncbi:MAG: hypothetical protein UHG91_00660 [Succinivibrionaceae bacterium]|uniref:hypothetical protein n=1 Tax=Faecalibacillus faecis TaxID=1982628 RepID=UPI002ECBD5B5|nr:hypothetical protein [Succinivibrionaceae bacterium]